MNRHVNIKKVRLFKEKITKSYITFSENKPNSPIVQLNASLFITMIYAISASLTKVKNKPNSNPIQTQSNPMKADFNANQTQSKPIQSQSLKQLRITIYFVALPACPTQRLCKRPEGPFRPALCPLHN